MKKHNLLIPVTIGITKEQFINWVDNMINHFGAKNTHKVDNDQALLVINDEVTEEDVKFAENTLSDICEKPCDIMCIRGTEETWDKATDGHDLLIIDL